MGAQMGLEKREKNTAWLSLIATVIIGREIRNCDQTSAEGKCSSYNSKYQHSMKLLIKLRNI